MTQSGLSASARSEREPVNEPLSLSAVINGSLLPHTEQRITVCLHPASKHHRSKERPGASGGVCVKPRSFQTLMILCTNVSIRSKLLFFLQMRIKFGILKAATSGNKDPSDLSVFHHKHNVLAPPEHVLSQYSRESSRFLVRIVDLDADLWPIPVALGLALSALWFGRRRRGRGRRRLLHGHGSA